MTWETAVDGDHADKQFGHQRHPRTPLPLVADAARAVAKNLRAKEECLLPLISGTLRCSHRQQRKQLPSEDQKQ